MAAGSGELKIAGLSRVDEEATKLGTRRCLWYSFSLPFAPPRALLALCCKSNFDASRVKSRRVFGYLYRLAAHTGSRAHTHTRRPASQMHSDRRSGQVGLETKKLQAAPSAREPPIWRPGRLEMHPSRRRASLQHRQGNKGFSVAQAVTFACN